MAKGDFIGLPLATLTSLRDKYVTCLEAIAVAGSSYSIAGRSFSRANLGEVRDTIAELTLPSSLSTALVSARPTPTSREKSPTQFNR